MSLLRLARATAGAASSSAVLWCSNEAETSGLQYASSSCIPTSWAKCKLVQVAKYNHDTSVFVFATPDGATNLNLPVCGCLLLRAPGREHGGGDAVRPYTPIGESGGPSDWWHALVGTVDARGRFALLIKRYAEWGVKPVGDFDSYAFRRSYRPEGAVSTYLHDGLAVGDSVDFKHVPANVKQPYPFVGTKRINMIAVGAGLAPMVQALDKILHTPGDATEVVLMLGNRSVADILLRETLDAWAETHRERFKVVYAVGSRWANVHVGMKKRVKKEGFATTHRDLATPPELDGFDGLPTSPNQAKETGWVGKDCIAKHAFPPSDDTLTFVCGLPSVYDSLCGPRDDPEVGGALGALGYDARRVIKF